MYVYGYVANIPYYIFQDFRETLEDAEILADELRREGMKVLISSLFF